MYKPLSTLDSNHLQYTHDSRNTKTGPVIQQYIGASREESKASCSDCPLLTNHTCYAQYATPAIGHGAILRSVRKGQDRSLEHAIEHNRYGKALRFGAIGDPAAIMPSVYMAHDAMARANGLAVLSYTHQWHLEPARHLKGYALASCDTMLEVYEALSQGWRCAVHVPASVPWFNGRTIAQAPRGYLTIPCGAYPHTRKATYRLCLAQDDTVRNKQGKVIDCNACRLCDGTRRSAPKIIVFIDHGKAMLASNKRKANKVT